MEVSCHRPIPATVAVFVVFFFCLYMANILFVSRTNSFMDQMNDEFFRPRGLYCLIISYSPIALDTSAKPDPAQALSSREPQPSDAGFFSTAKHNLRDPTAATSQGPESLPVSVATLVYPDASKAPSSPSSPETKKRKMAFARLNDYFDRRAQARYVRLSELVDTVRTNGGNSLFMAC